MRMLQPAHVWLSEQLQLGYGQQRLFCWIMSILSIIVSNTVWLCHISHSGTARCRNHEALLIADGRYCSSLRMEAELTTASCPVRMSEKKTSVVWLPPLAAGCWMDHSASAWIAGAGAVEGEDAAVPGSRAAAQHSTARRDTAVYAIAGSHTGWHGNMPHPCCGLPSSHITLRLPTAEGPEAEQEAKSPQDQTCSHPRERSPCMCI